MEARTYEVRAPHPLATAQEVQTRTTSLSVLEARARVIRLPEAETTSTAPVAALGVLDAVHDVIRDIVSDAWDELALLPAYGNLSERHVPDVLRAVGRATSTLVWSARHDEALGDKHEAFFRSLGSESAWRRLPLAAVEEAFWVVQRCAYLHLDRITLQQPARQGAHARAWLHGRMLRLIPEAWRLVEAGYHAAATGNAGPRQLRLQELADDMLDGSIDETRLRDELERRGIRTTGPWQPIFVVPRRIGACLSETVEGVCGTVPAALSGTPHDDPLMHAVVFAGGPIDEARLGDVARDHDAFLVLAGPTRLAGLPSTCDQIRRDLRLLPTVVEDASVVPALRLLRVGLFEGDVATAEVFAGVALNAVLGDLGARWDPLRTLGAVHDCEGDIKAAAVRLGLGERTVRRHLRWIADRLGTEPKTLVSSWDIRTALLLLRRHRDELPALDEPVWNERYGQ